MRVRPLPPWHAYYVNCPQLLLIYPSPTCEAGNTPWERFPCDSFHLRWLGTLRDICQCLQRFSLPHAGVGATGHHARAAVKLCIMHRAVNTAQEAKTQNANSAKAKDPELQVRCLWNPLHHFHLKTCIYLFCLRESWEVPHLLVHSSNVWNSQSWAIWSR